LVNNDLENALALHKAGRLKEAEAAYRKIIAENQQAADAYHFLGLIEAATGRLEAAETSIARAVELKPDRPTFHYNLGFVVQGLERFGRALEHYQKSLRLDPNQPAGHYNAGLVLSRLRRYDEAAKAFEAAIALQPNYAEAWGNLGAARRLLGNLEGAITACRKALEINPNQAEVLATLGNAAKEQGDYGAALEHYKMAINLKPDLVTAHFNLGNTYTELGETAEGRAALEKAVALDPNDRGAQDNLLMSRLYDEGESEQSLFEAHAAAAKALPQRAQPPRQPRLSGDRLKLGFVSADFKRHSCAYFLEPLFKALDRKAFSLHAYSMTPKSDEITEQLRGLVDHWTDCIPLGDEELAKKIEADCINILIDLSGHTSGNRLAVFARRPAPIQVSWLGYPATTGLTAIDARITDVYADPEGPADRWHSEKLIRLPKSFLLYGPPTDAPEVAPPPLEATGYITFGSFNNLSKINSAVIEAWSRILLAVPNSRLMLKGKTMGSPGVRERLTAQFGKQGIESDRLDLIDWISRDQNPLALYSQMDIALDTFPYNGTTTTCEALWMGVPVVSFSGFRHAGRVGASLLTSIGLTECLGLNQAAYKEIAIALANAPEKLAELRQNLRQQMAASPLCDSAGYARNFESALRDLWSDTKNL